MAKDSALQSLIPYLDSTAHPFALKISFLDQPSNSSENELDPFIILNDRESLTRLFMGKVVTNIGKVFKDLFLLIQRDKYLLPENTPSSLTNSQVEVLWQQAFHLLSTQDGEAITFSGRLTDDGKLLPFRSLFYCSFRDLFFHPPCPVCGGLLDLCTADEVLKAEGLPPYSSSLERYLYCPSCTDAGRSTGFFAPRKEEGDPPVLSDLHNLIRGFRQALGNTRESFPCSPCPENAACYGIEGKADSRILPFSFFPFYLMAFDSFPVRTMNLLKPGSRVATETPMSAPPQRDQSGPEKGVEELEESNRAIRDILLTIRKKWEAYLPKPDKQPKVKETEKVPEKVIKELPVDMLEKTMIFSPGKSAQKPSAAEKELREDAPEDQLEKTMIAGLDKIGDGQPKPAEEKKKTEDIPKTIIMSLDDLKGKKHDK